MSVAVQYCPSSRLSKSDSCLKMKSEYSQERIHKEVVIIGNGPSGIALSYMLSGNLPYLISSSHPDEMLSTRLSTVTDPSLIDADLELLATGLEGRSTNPISLLLDHLLHPCADIGIEIEPLVEFRKIGKKIDHVVLGNGLPGGSWHKMDPQILTLSLGNWMSLPGLPFNARDSGENRAYASSVARYYVQYVEEMNLSKYFVNNTHVTTVRPVTGLKTGSFHETNKEEMNWVKKIDENDRISVCTSVDSKNKFKKCIISNAINYIWNRGSSTKQNCCKRPRDHISNGKISNRKIRDIGLKPGCADGKTMSSDTESCDSTNSCDSTSSNDYYTYSIGEKVPFYRVSATNFENNVNWIVEAEDVEIGKRTIYTCKYLVLANGCNDVPNKLNINMGNEPDWLLYDLRTLEWCLDSKMNHLNDPVLVVGAGLSAADAVIAVRGRRIPVIHAFRNKSAHLNRQLPENMYPEYHKVHQMMQDGGSSYPLYSSYPEFTLTGIDEKKHSVILTSREGLQVELKVSFAIVLIGSRPDLTFLPNDKDIAVKQNLPIDGKTNTVNIDNMTHRVKDYENLYAVGTLAGDNFVRFIPGGALAVVADLYKREEVNET